MKRALVTGAGGFIGAALVRYLKAKGYWVKRGGSRPLANLQEMNMFILSHAKRKRC
jgi:nucleoside-diphosphate-sugar epimerase